MRITNNMMINSSLMGLQRSFELFRKYDEQVISGKKISKAAEDPVIASKALRYNTRLYEIDQYKSNVSEARSWLTSTSSTLSSTYDSLEEIRGLIQDCASETVQDSDRIQNLIKLKELRLKIAQDSNTNVAGRYLLSGYRTDTPLMFNGNTDIEYKLKETLDYTDSSKINAREDETKKSYSIKLLYGSIADGAVDIKNLDTDTDKYVIEYVNQSKIDAYEVPDATTDATTGVTTHTIKLIKDTGELVFNEEDYKQLNHDIDVEYTKTRFSEGDPNPVHYLKCKEKVELSNPSLGKMKENKVMLEKTYGIEPGTIRGLSIGGQTIIDSNGVVQKITVGATEVEAKIVYSKSTDKSSLGEDEIRINTDTGEIKFGSAYNALDGKVVQVDEYYKKETNPKLNERTNQITYEENLAGTINNKKEIKMIKSGTIDKNSIQGLDFKQLNPANGKFESIPGITIRYTTSSDTTAIGDNEAVVYMDTGVIKVGDNIPQGAEVDVDNLFQTEVKEIGEEIRYEVSTNSRMVVNTLGKDVYTMDMIKQLDLLINRIENFNRDEVTDFLGRGLTELDNHIESVLKQDSIVGSKLNRIELIETRLADDRDNFRELSSDNINVDTAEAASNLALQEMIYNAALSSVSKVLQSSLLDFLQ